MGTSSSPVPSASPPAQSSESARLRCHGRTKVPTRRSLDRNRRAPDTPSSARSRTPPARLQGLAREHQPRVTYDKTRQPLMAPCPHEPTAIHRMKSPTPRAPARTRLRCMDAAASRRSASSRASTPRTARACSTTSRVCRQRAPNGSSSRRDNLLSPQRLRISYTDRRHRSNGSNVL